MKMTNEQMRELDAWIDVYIFNHTYQEAPKYTADAAAALSVLKKCAEKCYVGIGKYRDLEGFDGWRIDSGSISSVAETLELAIALFAKSLYSK